MNDIHDEQQRIGQYWEESWRNLAKFQRDYVAGRYSEALGLEKQNTLELEIDAWQQELDLLVKVDMLHNFLRLVK